MNVYLVDVGYLMYGYYFIGGGIMDGVWVSGYHIDGGDIMDRDWALRDGPPIHGNHSNDNGNVNGVSLLESFELSTCSSISDTTSDHTPSVLNTVQGTGTTLL